MSVHPIFQNILDAHFGQRTVNKVAMHCSMHPGRECDGCMRCQETAYTTCKGCGGNIYDGQNCYRIAFTDDRYCEDCMVQETWEADDEPDF